MKNKRIISCAIVSFTLFAQEHVQSQIAIQEDANFELEVEIKDAKKNSNLYLSFHNGEKWVNKDSMQVENGKTLFKGKIELPEVWYIRTEDSKEKFPVFIESSAIKVKINLQSKEASVSGSKSHELLNDFENFKAPFGYKLDSISKLYYAARDEKDEAIMERLDLLYESIDSARISATNDYVVNHNESIIGPYILYKYLMYGMNVEEIMELQSTFPEKFDSSIYVSSINNYVSILKLTAIGSEAPDFTQVSPAGDSVSLSDFKGHYVLVDFWASWCGPCRRENPNVVKVYNEFHDNGFEILGVSLDQNEKNWLKAIESDGLVWTHVSDLNGWSNSVANKYGIKSIPSSFLIDPNGIIIAKNLFGEELENAVREIYTGEN